MKIAFINIYQGKVERGAETFVNELSKRFAKEHEVSVLGFAVEPKPRLPVLWRMYLDPFGLQTFFYTLRFIPTLLREKIDVVIPVNGGWQPAIVRLATWVYGGKMIISGQSGIGWDDRNNLWCFPDRFVALTNYAAKWAKRVSPFVNIETIPNGVDIDKFSSEKSKIEFNLQRPIILVVAALTKSKRLDLAIKAVSKLKRGSLLLVGKGEEEGGLKNLGEKLLGKKFKIMSFPHEEMPKVYKSADVLTFPTNPNESFGIVLLEAMAAGLPIVASNDPIRREIIGDAGIFLDPENTEEYSTALRKAIENKWGDKPVNQAIKFDWDKVASMYENLFSQLNK